MAPRFKNLDGSGPHRFDSVLKWAVTDKLAGRRRKSPDRAPVPRVEPDLAGSGHPARARRGRAAHLARPRELAGAARRRVAAHRPGAARRHQRRHPPQRAARRAARRSCRPSPPASSPTTTTITWTCPRWRTSARPSSPAWGTRSSSAARAAGLHRAGLVGHHEGGPRHRALRPLAALEPPRAAPTPTRCSGAASSSRAPARGSTTPATPPTSRASRRSAAATRGSTRRMLPIGAYEPALVHGASST